MIQRLSLKPAVEIVGAKGAASGADGRLVVD